MEIEDLEVYQRLCRLHIEICDLSHDWPGEERYELGSQVRRSSNSAPAQLAERYDDRHLRNKIEGVNRGRGEASETIHHLYVALLKGYIDQHVFDTLRGRYKECIRMLNGMERTLEMNLPEPQRRWPAQLKDAEALTYAPDPAPEPLDPGLPPPEPSNSARRRRRLPLNPEPSNSGRRRRRLPLNPEPSNSARSRRRLPLNPDPSNSGRRRRRLPLNPEP